MKEILRASRDIQALNLAGHNLNYARKKKKRVKDLVRLGAGNIAGVALLQAESQMIEQ